MELFADFNDDQMTVAFYKLNLFVFVENRIACEICARLFHPMIFDKFSPSFVIELHAVCFMCNKWSSCWPLFIVVARRKKNAAPFFVRAAMAIIHV